MANPASVKAKGRRLQQFVSDKIRYHFPWLTIRDVHSTPMGKNGPDVELSQAAFDVFPYDVECKSHKTFSIYNSFNQTVSHGTGEPLLVIKADRKPELAIVTLNHFMELVEKAHNANQDL